MIVRLLLPMAVALAAAYVFDFGRIAGAALVGAAFWLGMKLAGRPMPLQFSAFAMFAAVIFGFMAAVFASFTGKSVYEMLAAPLAEQFVGITLACAAVAFGALALVGGLWTLIGGRSTAEPDRSESSE